jgi:N-formylmaleamate deformylase
MELWQSTSTRGADDTGTRIAPLGRSAFVDVNGLRLHYLTYGESGAPLVIVPGITSPAITWEFVAAPLSNEFRVIIVDTRGRGLSESPSSGYTLREYADDLIGLVRGVGLVQPVVIGHSMGARIVAAAAADMRQAFGPVVIVDPPLSGLGRDPYPFPLDGYINALRQAQAGASADDMRRYYPTWPDRELRIRADWLSTCDERAVVETYCNFHIEDFFDYWPAVVSPALFLYGAESPVVPSVAIDEIVSSNPSAEVSSIAHAGHMIPFENLDEFVSVLRNYCQRQAVENQGESVGPT